MTCSICIHKNLEKIVRCANSEYVHDLIAKHVDVMIEVCANGNLKRYTSSTNAMKALYYGGEGKQ